MSGEGDILLPKREGCQVFNNPSVGLPYSLFLDT